MAGTGRSSGTTADSLMLLDGVGNIIPIQHQHHMFDSQWAILRNISLAISVNVLYCASCNHWRSAIPPCMYTMVSCGNTRTSSVVDSSFIYKSALSHVLMFPLFWNNDGGIAVCSCYITVSMLTSRSLETTSKIAAAMCNIYVSSNCVTSTNTSWAP